MTPEDQAEIFRLEKAIDHFRADLPGFIKSGDSEVVKACECYISKFRFEIYMIEGELF